MRWLGDRASWSKRRRGSRDWGGRWRVFEARRAQRWTSDVWERAARAAGLWEERWSGGGACCQTCWRCWRGGRVWAAAVQCGQLLCCGGEQSRQGRTVLRGERAGNGVVSTGAFLFLFPRASVRRTHDSAVQLDSSVHNDGKRVCSGFLQRSGYRVSVRASGFRASGLQGFRAPGSGDAGGAGAMSTQCCAAAARGRRGTVGSGERVQGRRLFAVLGQRLKVRGGKGARRRRQRMVGRPTSVAGARLLGLQSMHRPECARE